MSLSMSTQWIEKMFDSRLCSFDISSDWNGSLSHCQDRMRRIHLFLFATCISIGSAASIQALEHVPVRGRQLLTTVNSVAGLTSALSDATVSHIMIASGHYGLSTELSVTRSVTIEAAVPGSVVLDAQASSSAQRRVMNINPGSSGVVNLVGLNITGGYLSSVCARLLTFP